MKKRLLLYVLLAIPLAALGYGAWVWGRIATEVDDRHWNLPAEEFAPPLELYSGRRLTADDLRLELRRLGYGPVSGQIGPGLFRNRGGAIDVHRRAFTYDGGAFPQQVLHVDFSGGRIAALEDGEGNAVP